MKKQIGSIIMAMGLISATMGALCMDGENYGIAAIIALAGAGLTWAGAKILGVTDYDNWNQSN